MRALLEPKEVMKETPLLVYFEHWRQVNLGVNSSSIVEATVEDGETGDGTGSGQPGQH